MLETLQEALSPAAIAAVVWVTDWGGPLGWLIAWQLVFYLLGIGRAVFVGLVGIAALLLNAWLKWWIAAPRPYFLDPALLLHSPTEGFGMPSGHAQGAAAIWIAVALVVTTQRGPGRAALALALIWVLAVAGSRVLLGVHSTNQVLVGAGLGLALVIVARQVAPALGDWFARQSVSRAVVWTLLGAAVAAGISAWIVSLRAGFTVPTLWRDNFAVHAEDVSALQASTLFDPAPAFALIAAAAGTVGVALLQRQWPQRLQSRSLSGLAVLVGLLVTAAFFWLAGRGAVLDSAAALLLPLLYPVICGYLPVWLVCAGRSRR